MERPILITGGSGLVGRALASCLRHRGLTVSAPKIALEDTHSWQMTLSSQPWGAVVHLAAASSFEFCEANPEIIQVTNVNSTGQLAELTLRTNPAAHFIFASTAQVYDISSNVLTETSALNPKSVYSRSKFDAENLLRKTSDSGLKTTVLRIFNHSHCSQKPTFFLPSVYQQMLQLKSEAKKALLVGNVDVERDIGAVSDLARALTEIATHGDRFDTFNIYNVCSGQKRVLRNLISLMGQYLGIECELQVDPTRYRQNDPPSVVGSFAKLERKIGWRPLRVTDNDLIQSFLDPLPT